MLQAVLPHLTAAVELQHRLVAAEQRHNSLAQLLDSLETGVILTDASARPSFVNVRAARIVAEDDGLSLAGGRLAAATPLATRELFRAIAAVGCGAWPDGRRVRVERPSQRPPLLLRVLPVQRMELTVPGAPPAPLAAVFIIEPDASMVIDRLALAEVYGLTRREADVASLLASGFDLEAIATRLGLGIGTVRHHLKGAFGKTGAHTQARLVACIRSFAQRP